MKQIVYLDNAASTRVHDEVLQAMLPYFSSTYGNASSLHTMGQEARKAIETARKRFAELIGATEKEIIFTGGGTESDNMAILGTVRRLKSKGNHVITSNIEHPAVRNTVRHLKSEGFEITEIPVRTNGIIAIEDIKAAIQPATILITIMWANNEIGTIQPVEELAALADEKGIIFHTDAVQALGKIPINMAKSKIHLLSASAHKIMGPKGIGLLYIRNGGKHPTHGKFIDPIIFGGGHEFGYRPSTENTAGIIGFTKALEITVQDMEAESQRERQMRDGFIDWALENIPDSTLHGDREKRLANNMNLGFKYIEGESMLLYLNQEGYEVSTGSACSSKSLEPSHVLLALGMKKEEAHGSLRITLGRDTKLEDLEGLKPVLKKIVEKLRKFSPLAPESCQTT
jgi:cysteine desulfurase